VWLLLPFLHLHRHRPPAGAAAVPAVAGTSGQRPRRPRYPSPGPPASAPPVPATRRQDLRPAPLPSPPSIAGTSDQRHQFLQLGLSIRPAGPLVLIAISLVNFYRLLLQKIKGGSALFDLTIIHAPFGSHAQLLVYQ